jgi:16S rRNA (cytidine1402-2'-O)-methyltransferase
MQTGYLKPPNSVLTKKMVKIWIQIPECHSQHFKIIFRRYQPRLLSYFIMFIFAQKSMKGHLYLIPTTLGEQNPADVIPAPVLQIASSLRYFIVENTRTARRFLRSFDPAFPIDGSSFVELNEHTKAIEIEKYLDACENGFHIGLISEVGVPGVADPGSDVVKLAHQKGIRVIPLVGPSSILLAIMASGLNGQNFAFNGYLPVKPNDRTKAIKHFEKRSQSEKQSQIFIETPYRNNALFDEFLKTLLPDTRLTVAVDITLASEQILTFSIKEWGRKKIDLHKHPAIFIILG